VRDGERKKRKNARKDIEVTDEEEEEEEEEPACVFSETLLLLLSLLLLLLLLLLNFVVAEQKKSARVYFSLSLSQLSSVISLSFTPPHPAASNP
jgi:hypothetical protein